MRTMQEVIESYGDWAHGGDVVGIAKEWETCGFSPDGAAEWLAAGAFDAHGARVLQNNMTPAQAAKRIDVAGTQMTIGYAYCNGDIDMARAKEEAEDKTASALDGFAEAHGIS